MHLVEWFERKTILFVQLLCNFSAETKSEFFQNHLRYAQIDNLIILEYDSFGHQQASLSLNPAKRV